MITYRCSNVEEYFDGLQIKEFEDNENFLHHIENSKHNLSADSRRCSTLRSLKC